jgi:hypothetical protein
MLDKVNIALYISDSQSAIMLPNMKGEVDMNVLLFGNDPMLPEQLKFNQFRSVFNTFSRQ